MAGVQLELSNHSSVSDSVLEELVTLANLPECRLFVNAGATDLPPGHLGLCFPAFLTELESVSGITGVAKHTWDIAIGISSRCTALAQMYPAIFAQIVAHELGHAHIALTDQALHVYCAFLDHNIRGASHDQVTMSRELPHELAHDRFGVSLSDQLYGRHALRHQISVRITDGAERDPGRLRIIADLPPEPRYDSLRDDLRKFCLPWRDNLIAAWDEEFRAATENRRRTITEFALSIRSLLDVA